MMKRLWTLMVMLLAFIALIGCNNGSTLDGLDFDEQIAAPINLTISGESLSWDAVSDANGYYVFINGEKEDTVKSTSFDFSDVDGDRLIFTVVTKAPRGMQDSVHSVTIAYVKNKAQEVASMKTAVATSVLGFGDDFAEELVNKGMLASEFTTMMDALGELADAAVLGEDMVEDYYGSIDDLMDTISQPEALVSALVLHVLPDEINSQITQINEDIEYYQDMLDDPYSWNIEYYQERIAELNDEKDAMVEIIDMIDDSPDAVVSTIMVVIDYIMEFESLVSENFIGYINNLTNVDDVSDINVTEVVAIKEELVTILKETMPSQQDIVLAIQTIYSMSDLVESMADTEIGSLHYPEKMAASLMMSMEAYINFMDYLDQDFFQELKTIGTSDLSEYHMSAKMAILGITYFDGYKKEYQGLFDEMRDLYTDEEQKVMYDESIASAEDLMGSEPFMPAISFPSFEKMMAMDAIFQDAFDELLDAFVESDGKILLAIADLAEYADGRYEKGIEWNEFNYQNTIYSMKVVDQVIYLVNSVASERSEAEYVEIRDFLVDSFIEVAFTNIGEFSSAEQQDIKNAVKEYMVDTKAAQHDLVQSIAKYLDSNDTFLDYATLFETTYKNNYTKLEEEEMYFDFIFMMDVFDDYMTLGNRADVDKLVKELSTILGVDAINDLQDMSYLPDALDEALDYIDGVAKEISGFNPATLTTTQKNRIDDVMEHISSLLEIPE